MHTEADTFWHDSLGHIHLRPHPRARHYIFRYRSGDDLYITCPPGSDAASIHRLLQEKLPELLKLRRKHQPARPIDRDFRLETPWLHFSLMQTDAQRTTLECHPSPTLPHVYRLLIPKRYALDSTTLQKAVRRTLLNLLRRTAAETLPPRLEALARKHGFSYTAVHIRHAGTRWGSCTARRSISLSLYLMLLPEDLVDYVLCHELCHTVEMSHSPRFWQLLDRVMQTDSRRLRHRLKPYGQQISTLFPAGQ